MVLLRIEPTRQVSSLRALRELEHALSRRRADIYDDLADRSAELGNKPALQAFQCIAEMLRDSASSDAGGKAAAPDVHQDEDLGVSRLVTPYAAYSLAVRNQERAFAFWTYVSAHASGPEVRSEAERLAAREMEHARSLRTARRQAFHEDRMPEVPREALKAASLADLERHAGETEAALANLHARIAAALAASGNDRAAAISEAATEESRIAERLGARAPTQPKPLPHDTDALVALATEQLEVAAEFYLATAEIALREDVVAAAQALADGAIRRLSLLR